MSGQDEVHIIGAGGHAKVVIGTLEAAGCKVKAVYDDDERRWGGRLLGVPIVGAVADLRALGCVRAIVAIGDNYIRKVIAEALPQLDLLTVVHPRADVHASVRLGRGTVVFAGAVIQPDAVIGDNGIINTSATVDHDCVLGDYVQVAPGSHLSGNVRLDEGVFLGTGSSTVPGVRVGSWTTVGAGCVVVKDLPPDVVAVGVPAVVIKSRKNEL
ncbi:MAG TPA: acetyltransferase [Pyrinomonadaceae bacterium]|jgi:sugar O-acyltransferase (sialic acid O-acetyltransferase NeuD family)|nr:acetyltransferase [Pyrinomonadaceae bacterium]